MINYDIYWVRFKYEDDSTHSKWRPALIIDNAVVRVSKITSNLKRIETPYCVLKDWKTEGLKKPSLVRVTKVVHINPKSLEHSLGRYVDHLTDRDIESVEACLREGYIRGI